MVQMDLTKQTFSFRYSIDWKSDMDNYFDIDPVEGTISTNELLDRESIAQHNISIVATKLSTYDNRINGDSRLSFPCHNLCEGFKMLLLKSILNLILLERFIGDYKQ